MSTYFSFFLVIFLTLSSYTFGQVTLYEQNFDTLTVNQYVGNQITEIQPISGGPGGPDDALVTDEHAYSPSNSMKITNSKDMYYDCGGVTTGYYALEFNIFLHDQGYFNVQHLKQVGWACDVFLTSSNTILYQDNPNTTSATVVGNYLNDTWINFRFEIDIDNDEIKFFKNDTLLHTSVFTNATVGTGTNKLDGINFYGLSGGFQGVNSTYMYIDDFKFINLGTSVGVVEEESYTFQVFPNPAINEINLTDLQGDANKIEMCDYTGRIVYVQQMDASEVKIDLDKLQNGYYIVAIEFTDGRRATQKILIER